jgi:hypothetical protein
MSTQNILSSELSTFLDTIVARVKGSIGESKTITLNAAWSILQLITSDVIQTIENKYPDLKGANKKDIALTLISSFYDSVFLIVTIPYVPSIIQPIIKQYTKAFLMLLVAATIDSMVQIFKQTGIFKTLTQGK